MIELLIHFLSSAFKFGTSVRSLFVNSFCFFLFGCKFSLSVLNNFERSFMNLSVRETSVLLWVVGEYFEFNP